MPVVEPVSLVSTVVSAVSVTSVLDALALELAVVLIESDIPSVSDPPPVLSPALSSPNPGLLRVHASATSENEIAHDDRIHEQGISPL